MKVRVKILDAIAGLADPDVARLDLKYGKLEAGLRAQEKPPQERAIRERIAVLKKSDRYDENPIGFKKDWAFKPGKEALIEEDLARKWADAEICALIERTKSA